MLDALNPPRFLHDSPWPARLATLLALLFFLWAAIQLTWLLLAGPELPTPGASRTALPEPSELRQPGEIARWHLFGSRDPTPDLAALAAKRLQETGLKLNLRGTLNESDPRGGIAIIADETGKDHPYRAGDALPGDARLEQILVGVVVLSHNGVEETLSLRLDPDATGAPSGAPATRGRTPAHSALPGSNAITGQLDVAIKPGVAPGAVDMQTWRAANLPNVQELARQVQVFPVFANGRMRGVRLSAGRDSDILQQAGIEPGDIVTAVNGIPLDNPGRQSQLLASLRDARQVQIDVERDGRSMKLQFGP